MLKYIRKIICLSRVEQMCFRGFKIKTKTKSGVALLESGMRRDKQNGTMSMTNTQQMKMKSMSTKRFEY